MGSKRYNRDEDSEDPGECSTFTISGFYGNAPQTVTISRLRDKFGRVAKASKHMEESPLPSVYNPGVLGPPSTWEVFPRQAEAIKYSQLQGEGLMVFAYESDTLGGEGRRSFVVAHPRLMWKRVMERNPRHRCSYEVIQEYSVCKLYFDLEFSYLYNQGKDGNTMVNTFIQIICYFIQKEFGINCTRQNVIDLNSCSFLKFSRHLIFSLPEVAFATNIHVGNFVMMICNKIRKWKSESSVEIDDITLKSLNELFVQDSNKNTVLFCDEGVYTKNRNFRLLHSSKHGKNTPLTIAKENLYKAIPKNGICKDEQFFLDSMVTTVDERSRILTFGENTSKVQKLPTKKGNVNDLSGNDDGFSSSPYPEIDSHIYSVVQPGFIRSWFYFSQSELLVYEIGHNRYCHNVGREHQSNGIMYVVNLKTGTYYQKCHDPDCRDFRSNVWSLPESAVFWKKLGDDEMMELAHSVGDFEDVEDEILVTAVNQAELEEMSMSDEELRTLADNFEMWDNVDMLSSRSASQQSSQRSTLSLSQASNPWDKLSQLSTPDSLCFASMSEMTMSIDELSRKETSEIRQRESINGIGEKLSDAVDVIEISSDEEFAREAARIEEEVLSSDSNSHNSEVEFNTYKL